jgi:hypothetical protein
MLCATLVGLLGSTAHHALSYTEFLELDLPAGVDRDELWDDLQTIHSAQAIHYRDTESAGGVPFDDWYTPTWSIGFKLQQLQAKTREGSPLDRAINERFGERFMVRPLIEETAAAAACDGIPVDIETVDGLAEGRYEPRDDRERVVANVHALLNDVVRAPKREMTPALIREMYARITAGVDTDRLSTGIPWGIEWPIDPMGREEALAQVCSLANGRLCDPYEHPVVIAERICCKFWKTSPFRAATTCWAAW